MNQLPNPLPDGERLDQLAQATISQQQVELEIFRHHLLARYVAECEVIDIEARGDVAWAGLDEELKLLDKGMAQAAGSTAAAKAELVARKVDLLVGLDNTRFARFGR